MLTPSQLGLDNGRYVLGAKLEPIVERCPHCKATGTHPRYRARGKTGSYTLPIDETLVVCSRCGRGSMQVGTIHRIVQALTSLLLTVFTSTLFVGALVFDGYIVRGSFRGTLPEWWLALLMLVTTIVSGIGFWIPFRKVVQACKPGLVPVDVPLEL